jgi:hypothetical protein
MPGTTVLAAVVTTFIARVLRGAFVGARGRNFLENRRA